MINSEMACPKCKSAMEEGFIVDFAHGGSKKVSDWVEGELAESFWWGLKTWNREKHRVKTYRCIQCGYLESYAPLSQD